MTTVLLVRHGRTTANASGILAGWTPGVDLDEHGVSQVRTLGERLRDVPIAAVVTSPLERTRSTTQLLLHGRDVPVHTDVRVAEVQYGDWTGKALKDLAQDPLWKVVQQNPSAMVFPAGESMLAMSMRGVSAIHDWNAKLGPDATYVVVSHGDVIKAILADALGLHLDQFQRINVDPASLSVIRYNESRAFVERVNDSGGVGSLLASSGPEPVVGGGAGAPEAH